MTGCSCNGFGHAYCFGCGSRVTDDGKDEDTRLVWTWAWDTWCHADCCPNPKSKECKVCEHGPRPMNPSDFWGPVNLCPCCRCEGVPTDYDCPCCERAIQACTDGRCRL